MPILTPEQIERLAHAGDPDEDGFGGGWAMVELCGDEVKDVADTLTLYQRLVDALRAAVVQLEAVDREHPDTPGWMPRTHLCRRARGLLAEAGEPMEPMRDDPGSDPVGNGKTLDFGNAEGTGGTPADQGIAAAKAEMHAHEHGSVLYRNGIGYYWSDVFGWVTVPDSGGVETDSAEGAMREEVNCTHCWHVAVWRLCRAPEVPGRSYCQICGCPADHDDAKLPCPGRELYRYEPVLNGSYVRSPRQVEWWG